MPVDIDCREPRVLCFCVHVGGILLVVYDERQKVTMYRNDKYAKMYKIIVPPRHPDLTPSYNLPTASSFAGCFN